MSAPAMIALTGVSKSHGAVAALTDANLIVPRGAFVALIGGSGAGKSTLLKTINALIEPDTGTVSVEGVDVRSVEHHALRRRIGYVFQEVGLFPHLSVAANIAVTPRLLGWDKARIAARVDELLDLVALPRNLAARRPAALSGGQRQRVGVARALAAQPALMLMDEPFGALDPVTRAALGEDYHRLHDRLGLTTVMVTHDVTEAILLADRIVVMAAGRIVADAAPRDFLSGHADPTVAALFETPRRQAQRVREIAGG